MFMTNSNVLMQSAGEGSSGIIAVFFVLQLILFVHEFTYLQGSVLPPYPIICNSVLVVG